MDKLIFEPSAVAIFLSDENLNQIRSGENLLEIFAKKVFTIFPDLKVYVNRPLEIGKFFPNAERIESTDELSFLKGVSSKLPSSVSGDSDIDEVFFAYFVGIYPLLDILLTKELLSRHKKYLAQYSYSENLPHGIVPIFLSREFVQSLPIVLDTSAHEYLLKNINNFDVEIFYSPPDLRQYRLDFTLGDTRSRIISNLLLQEKKDANYLEILPILKDKPAIFRCAPSYFEFEIFRGCLYKCSFCPRQFISNDSDGQMLTRAFIEKFLEESKNAFQSPVTVCFGGMGEPLLHPDLTELMDCVLKNDYVLELIIETALYSDTTQLENYISSIPIELKKKLTLIINLSTLDERKYLNIYGENNLKSVLSKIDRLNSLLYKNTLHVQIIKIKEIENEIESYFNFFEEKKINVILQKYNRYAELMPEKRVSDLTPINRDFCWHLARDVYIRSDGKVTVCRQDFQRPVGDLNNESINEIWAKGHGSFSKSLCGDHSEVNAPCTKCDEWYTFNA